jgi:hypothetical protein
MVTMLEATELLLTAYLGWAYRLLEEARVVCAWKGTGKQQQQLVREQLQDE